MSGPERTDALVVAPRVDDPALLERLAMLLADVPGIRLAAPGEPADLDLVVPTAAAPVPAFETALTPREAEVLALLSEGASNKAIALRLGLSVHTIKFHVGRLLDKLDATGRTDAVAHAARRGVIHL